METLQIENPKRITPQNDATVSPWHYYVGYSFLAASALLYLTCEIIGLQKSDDNLTAFIAHYIIALIYLVFLSYDRAYGILASWRKENINSTIILLNLFLVSAYALNRILDVFQDSTAWLCVVLVITSFASLGFRFYRRCPPWVQAVLQATIGVGILLYTYMVIYVAPYYVAGAIGTILFGVGLHIFLPLFMVVGLIVMCYHQYRETDRSFYWVAVGAVLTLTYVIFFVLEWVRRIERIEKTAHQYVLDSNPELPVWIVIGETLEPDWISRRILKSELTYAVHHHNGWDFMPSRLSWDEVAQHDPLVYIGSHFAKTTLIQSDRVNILHALSENRHRSEERLWAGDNLTTSHVINDVDLYPELRFAYSEHYLDIRNNGVNGSWWGNTQEAMYTFQLPAGSVVTSLSLWIEGQEQKGILTSKEKAAKAYNTIVGKEQRDPSVVHWREGNTIAVRVFPCTPGEERKIKIGITTPLLIDNGELVYQNITFDGPSAANAKQILRVRFPETTNPVHLPATWRPDGKGYYTIEQNYDEDFKLRLPLTPIRENNFSFDGNNYSISELHPHDAHTSFDELYFDVNNAWTDEELDEAEKLIYVRNAFVCIDGEFVRLQSDNWKKLIPGLHRRNFTLFPFHKLKTPERVLVVTKGNPLSIQLTDLKGSRFSTSMQQFFRAQKRVKTFNLDAESSTYVSALRELKALHFASGNFDELKKILHSKQFPLDDSDASRVVLQESNVTITKTAGHGSVRSTTAPDHLMRLFAYNNIMRQLGHHYFESSFDTSALVTEAEQAYVVSPVSSLVVLETQADYDRFGIHAGDNTLHNATKQSTGAVPEPHEWMMIIACLLVMAYYKFRS